MPRIPKNKFRPKLFDPLLIVLQILTFQFNFYLIFSLLNLILSLMKQIPLNLTLIFNYHSLNPNMPIIWYLIFNYFLTSVISCFFLVFLVERVKLCLDFVLTFHVINFLLNWYFTGSFPKEVVWWLVNIVSFAVMTLGGEYCCMRWEMKPIDIDGSTNTSGRRGGVNQNDKRYRKLSTSSTLVDNDLELSEVVIGDDTIELEPLTNGRTNH